MRTYFIKVLSALTALVLAFVLAFGAAVSPEPVQAAPAPQCVVQVTGTVGLVVCAGVPVANVNLPTVQVTVPGPTITLPPVTLPPIELPGETVTVQVPGGTVTDTVTVGVPNETVTVTAEPTDSVPDGTQTVTSQPSSLPTDEATGQNPLGDDTIVDNDDDEPLVVIGDGKTTVVEATLGLLATILLVGLMLLALWAGYILGYKDKEKKDTSFMRALLDQARFSRAKHR